MKKKAEFIENLTNNRTMKTAEALDRIAIVTMDHLSKDAVIHMPSKLRLQVKTILESYAKEHALKFQKHMNELYGIGGFEMDDEIEYTEWIKQLTTE